MTTDIAASEAFIRQDMEGLAADSRLFRQAYEAGLSYVVTLRAPGFASLIKIILEQQISLAAAARMYTNLCAACEPLEPASFLKLDDRLLKECGFSRQKMVYARGLAEALLEGSLDLDEVGRLPDEQAIERLCRLKGIGPWSAQNYLLWSHGRRDIFPSNDLALMIGWQWLAGLDKRPSITELDEQALAWRPRRTAAAFLIWHYYLATRAAGTKAVATQSPPN